MDEATKFQTLVQFRVPEVLSGMIESAADKHLQSKSEYIRQSVLTALRADGFDPAAIPPRDAGSLYNVINGQRCYALVFGDRILAVTARLDNRPEITDINHHPAGYVPSEGDRWLQIEFEDSEPWIPGVNYRFVPPVTRIEAERVVRTYPVGEDHA